MRLLVEAQASLESPFIPEMLTTYLSSVWNKLPCMISKSFVRLPCGPPHVPTPSTGECE